MTRSSALSSQTPERHVDTAQPPYGNTRRLITKADVGNNANRAHNSVLPGNAAVKDASGKFIADNAKTVVGADKGISTVETSATGTLSLSASTTAVRDTYSSP